MSAVDGCGRVLLIGSGETAASGRAALDRVMRGHRALVRLAILETPAGFQPNSAAVAGRIAAFARDRLVEHRVEPIVVAARRRDGPGGANDPVHLEAISAADVIFVGAGSPTYAVRHLRGTRLWTAILDRWRAGASLVLASAAAVAVGAHCLPVYEIFKVGEDPTWRGGLDLLGELGLELAIVPHWDNAEGGVGLDTSRCFVGVARFAILTDALLATATVLGIDEHTSMLLDPAAVDGVVLGRRGITIVSDGIARRVVAGERIGFDALGGTAVTRKVPREAHQEPAPASVSPPPDIVELSVRRQEARRRGDWQIADEIRRRLGERGWTVADAPDGTRLSPR